VMPVAVERQRLPSTLFHNRISQLDPDFVSRAPAPPGTGMI
jgi:hypothetical protein